QRDLFSTRNVLRKTRSSFRLWSQLPMSFPVHRPRRLRKTELLRTLVRDTRLSTASFVYPLFVCPGSCVQHEVISMPGVFQRSADRLVEDCREVESLGIPSVIL